MSGFGGGRGGGARVKKVMTQPISLIFRFLQNVSRGAVGVDYLGATAGFFTAALQQTGAGLWL